jgi:hypothetical protein
MTNKNYVRGRRKEYKEIHKAKIQGKLSFRSAGSHSPVDVVIIDYVNKTIGLIQCKPESMSVKEKTKIYLENKHLEGTYLVFYDVR